MRIKRPPIRVTDSDPIYSLYWQLRHGKVLVRCPKCDGDALLSNTEQGFRLACNHCSFSEPRGGDKPLAAAQGCCISCGRWFNLRLPPAQSGYPRVKVVCPHCQTAQTAQVHSVGVHSTDPWDGLSLYLQAPYRGHIVWALNREHLDYLIGYVEAGLREKPVFSNGYGGWYSLLGGQAQSLPRWLKAAKNRPGLLRVLHRMQAL